MNNVEETPNQRLNKAYEYLKGLRKVKNKTDFATQLGNNRSYLSELLNGNKQISEQFAERLKETFNIDNDWLITGEGVMRRQNLLSDFVEIPQTRKDTGSLIAAKKAFIGRQQKGILFVPVTAQAGYSRMIGDDIEYRLDDLERTIIPGFPYDGDEYRAFQVEGDSMEYINQHGQIDGLQSGMWVLAQNVPQEDWAQNLNLYRIHVIVLNRQILIKRILQDNTTEIVLHSDNEDLHPQERIPLDEVKEIWYVVRKLDWNMPPPRKIDINV